MDAIRAVPSLSPLSWLLSIDMYELVRKFRYWTYLSSNDGIAYPDLDVRYVCSCLCGRVGPHLVDLSRDEGVGVGGGGSAVEGWVGG